MNFWQKLERYPPVLVRLLARHPVTGEALSDERVYDNAAILSDTAGLPALPWHDLQWIAHATDWDHVPVGKMQVFCHACNVDFTDPARLKVLNRYLKDAKFTHLKRHPDWPQFKKLLKIYADSQR